MDTYYTSLIAPNDEGTRVCWKEDDEGNAVDVLCESIPGDIDVIDLTYSKAEVNDMKVDNKTIKVDKAREKQIGGDHYQRNIQPWDIIDEYSLDFYRGTAIKYILRHKLDHKEDIQKAIHTLQKYLEAL